MSVRVSLAVLAFVLSASGAVAQEGRIDPDRLNAAVAVLAGDDFEGRAPTTPGEERSVTWIADQFRALGLEPAGDDGTYFQTVPINRFVQDGPAVITATTT